MITMMRLRAFCHCFQRRISPPHATPCWLTRCFIYAADADTVFSVADTQDYRCCFLYVYAGMLPCRDAIRCARGGARELTRGSAARHAHAARVLIAVLRVRNMRADANLCRFTVRVLLFYVRATCLREYRCDAFFYFFFFDTLDAPCRCRHAEAPFDVFDDIARALMPLR